MVSLCDIPDPIPCTGLEFAGLSWFAEQFFVEFWFWEVIALKGFVGQGWHKTRFLETCCLDGARWSWQDLFSLSLLLSEVAQAIFRGERVCFHFNREKRAGEIEESFFSVFKSTRFAFPWFASDVRNPEESNNEYGGLRSFQAGRGGIFCL